MTIKVRSDTGVKGVNSVRLRGATATQRAARIKFRTGLGVGDLDQIYTGVSPISVTVTPEVRNFFSNNNTTVSGNLTAMPSGGLAPFTYIWSVVSFDAASPPTFGTSTSASTSVTQTGVIASDTNAATLQVVVTDSAGQTGSATVPATFTNINFA